MTSNGQAILSDEFQGRKIIQDNIQLQISTSRPTNSSLNHAARDDVIRHWSLFPVTLKVSYREPAETFSPNESLLPALIHSITW